MESMPCANTSSMPACRAKSMSIWMGLWSPEAPAYKASVVRVMGEVSRCGIASPTWMVSKTGADAFIRPLLISDDGDRPKFRHQRAARFFHDGFADDEFERAAFFPVYVRNMRFELQRLAPESVTLIPEGLLAVQHFADLHAHCRQGGDGVDSFHLEREQKCGRNGEARETRLPRGVF